MSDDDEGPGGPPVPVCPRCSTQHFPSAPCPGVPNPGDKEPEG